MPSAPLSPDAVAPGPDRRSSRLPRLLVSNGLDAGAGRILDTVTDVVAVTTLGMTTTQLGLLNALGSISFLLLAVPLGALVDARGATRVLPVALAGKLALVAATAGLLITGHLTVSALMVLVTALGLLSVATENAQVSAVPQVAASRERIASAVASLSAADRVAGVVVPGATGLLLAAVGAGPLLVAAAVIAAAALLAALGLSRGWKGVVGAAGESMASDDDSLEAALSTGAQQEVEPGAKPASPAAELLDHRNAKVRHPMLAGFRELGGDRLLLASVLLTTAGNMGLAIGDSVEAVLVLRRLDLGAAYWGVLGSVGAVSGLVAAVVAPRVVRAVEPRRIFGLGALVQAVVAALPLAALLLPGAGAVLMVVFAALWSITLTVTNIAAGSYLAVAVDSSVLGRTSAASRTLTMGAVPVAALLGGWLGDVVGLAAPLVVWPALTAAAALVFVALTRRR